MYKIFAFLSKREGWEMQKFMNYYENHHVPLICGLAPAPSLYKRRYVERDQELMQGGGTIDFDVITELGFADQKAFSAWATQVNAGDQVATDEAVFLDRSKTRVYVVDERSTTGGCRTPQEDPSPLKIDN